MTQGQNTSGRETAGAKVIGQKYASTCKGSHAAGQGRQKACVCCSRVFILQESVVGPAQPPRALRGQQHKFSFSLPGAGEMAQRVKCPLSMPEDLSSNPHRPGKEPGGNNPAIPAQGGRRTDPGRLRGQPVSISELQLSGRFKRNGGEQVRWLSG